MPTSSTPPPTAPPATPTAADVAGSVQQTLVDLRGLAGDLAEQREVPPNVPGLDLAARCLDRLARELDQAARMARAITTHPRPQSNPVPFIGRTALNAILSAVSRAIDIPPPATPEDEMTYLRLRSMRAAGAVRALARILDDQNVADLDLAWTASNLDDAVEQYPIDYAVSAMTS